MNLCQTTAQSDDRRLSHNRLSIFTSADSKDDVFCVLFTMVDHLVDFSG